MIILQIYGNNVVRTEGVRNNQEEKERKMVKVYLLANLAYLTMWPVNLLFEKVVSSMLKLDTHRGARQSDRHTYRCQEIEQGKQNYQCLQGKKRVLSDGATLEC